MSLLLKITAVYLAVNAVVSWTMLIAYNAWAKSVNWSADGLMPSAEPFKEGAGDTAVLLIHGFNDVPYIWKRISGEFVKAGYATSAIRVQGSGERKGTATFEETRNAVMKEYLLLRAAHKEVFIVSHSFGGTLTIDLLNEITKSQASDNPLPKVSGAVLLAPLIEVSRARSPVLTPETWYRIVKVLVPALPYFPSIFKEYLCAEDDSSFRYRRDHFIHLSRYSTLFDAVRHIKNIAPIDLQVPLMVFAAGNDRVVDTGATRKWFSCCGENQNLIVVDGAPHVIPLILSWKEITDQMIDFMEKCVSVNAD